MPTHCSSRPPYPRSPDLPRLLLALLALLFSAQALAEIRWVRNIDSEPGSCEGLNGYSNIQLALLGLPPGEHHEIRVSHRYVHREIANLGRGVRIANGINGPSGSITISGGWECTGVTPDRPAGSLSQTSQRSRIAAIEGDGPVILIDRAYDVRFDQLILSGGRNTRLLPAANQGFAWGVGLSIEGRGQANTRISIRNTRFEDHRNIGQNGAALGISAAKVELMGVEFENNEALRGAGIYVGWQSQLLIAEDDNPRHPNGGRFQFVNNRAFGAGSSGAALHVQGVPSAASGSRVIIGNDQPTRLIDPPHEFRDNRAHNWGGALFLGQNTRTDVIGAVRFQGNRADRGGAIYQKAPNVSGADMALRIAADGRTIHQRRPAFVQNQADQEGGGIACVAIDSGRYRNGILVERSLFDQNQARLRGGAISSNGCNVMGDAEGSFNVFRLNQVTVGVPESSGPKARGGGAVFVRDARIHLGAETLGGAVFDRNAVPRTSQYSGRSCSFYAERCKAESLLGGGLLVQYGLAQLRNARMVGNSAPFGGGLAVLDSGLDLSRAGAGCAADTCPEFRDNTASGMSFDERTLHRDATPGAGAAVFVFNEDSDNVPVRIQHTRFTGNLSTCADMPGDCDRSVFDGTAVHLTGGPRELLLRGNLFHGHAMGPPSTGYVALVYVARGLHEEPHDWHKGAHLVQNTFHEPGLGLPLLRFNGGLNLVGNVLLGGPRGVLAPDQSAGLWQSVRVLACNLLPEFNNINRGLNANSIATTNLLQSNPTATGAALFLDAANGDYRLSASGSALVDVCTPQLAQADLSPLYADLDRDFALQPRPVQDPSVQQRLGIWDIGAHERQPSSPQLFANGFE